MKKLELLKSLDFGQSVAEQEIENLHRYFVQTKQWEDVVSGDVDIIYGPKGSGKSALYTLLNDNEEKLAGNRIVLRFAENPRGATVFSDLQTNPPAKELEFVNLWKLYLLSIIGHYFSRIDLRTYEGLEVVEALRASKLLEPGDSSIAVFLARARSYIKRFFDVNSFEPTISLNAQTGAPEGIGVKITFREPTPEAKELGVSSIGELIRKADIELKEQGLTVWFLLDRLDVAFADSPDLESNALRALFKVYLDFADLSNVKLKIFLRTDIWNRITKYGFREATHITKFTTIRWEEQTLLNLIMRRFLNNSSFNSALNIAPEIVLSSLAEQKRLFERIFPEKVDSGKNPYTLSWIVGRTKDAKDNYCPRDIINLINNAISRQIRLLEAGGDEPVDEILFDRAVLKLAFSDASTEKVEKHLFAEYPLYRPLFEALRDGKSEQNVVSLCKLWNTHAAKAIGDAQELVDIGFWTKEGKPGEYHYWIPFIYRDGLNISQGQADGARDRE